MPTNSPHATVKRTPISVHKPAAAVTTLETVIAAGNASPAVQASPVAKQALADLQTAVTSFNPTVTAKSNALSAVTQARSSLRGGFAAVEIATRTYETTVNALANGNAAIINQAGLLTRDQRTPPAALGLVKDVKGKQGTLARQAVLSWPAVPGATSYAIQVNFTPATPAGPYTALPSGSSRRRVIEAPTAGAQFLVQVAAVASNGTQSDWCEPLLVTAK